MKFDYFMFYISITLIYDFRFIFYLLKFSIVRAAVNKLMHKIIDKASNFNTEKLAEIHEKSNKVLPDFSLTYK